jgi:hypothetical protein
MISPFNEAGFRNLDNVWNSRYGQLLKKLNNGESLTAEEKLQYVSESGYFRSGGCTISFKKYQKRYWVKTKNYGIREVFAFNKTAIRKSELFPGGIIEILETS